MSDKVIASKIGFRIRDLRIALGLSQREMGRMVGVDDQSISNWERGVYQPPDSALELLAIKHNLPFEIFAEGGPMPHTLVNRPVNEQSDVDPGEALEVIKALRTELRELKEEIEFVRMENQDTRAELDELRSLVEFTERARR